MSAVSVFCCAKAVEAAIDSHENKMMDRILLLIFYALFILDPEFMQTI